MSLSVVCWLQLIKKLLCHNTLICDFMSCYATASTTQPSPRRFNHQHHKLTPSLLMEKTPDLGTILVLSHLPRQRSGQSSRALYLTQTAAAGKPSLLVRRTWCYWDSGDIVGGSGMQGPLLILPFK